MNRWFRFYSAAMRDPKVLKLSDREFRLWVSLLSIASENDGHIPEIGTLKMMLGMRYDHAYDGLKRLASYGLIDALGDGYTPHNWGKYQYKSDTSNERVAKHRAKRNVTVTPPDTDTDTEVIANAITPPISPRKNRADDPAFSDFWNAYPRRTAKEAARKAWAAAIKRGVSPEQLTAAAARYAERPPDDPRFIPHPATWLNQGRYDDEITEAPHGNLLAGSGRTVAGDYRPSPGLEWAKRQFAVRDDPGAIEADAWP